ncbi:MAG: hypothetical protein JSV70_09795 [bacterium]|nr:MAG: hypothetical protein JSV70_09795 [bacterium]
MHKEENRFALTPGKTLTPGVMLLETKPLSYTETVFLLISGSCLLTPVFQLLENRFALTPGKTTDTGKNPLVFINAFALTP